MPCPKLAFKYFGPY
jgi:hypothetical protein